MSLSKDLHKEIEQGRLGKTGIIPFHYQRVRDYIDIAKNTMTVVGGESGSGKSSTAHDLFVINPIQWYLQNKNPDIKLSVIYFGMERKQFFYTGRWISRLIFQEQGISIPLKRILGRHKDHRMTDQEYKLVQSYYERIDEWEQEDLLICHEGSKNPTGISKYLEAFARKHGTIIDKDIEDKSMENILGSRKYIPNHPNHIVLVVTDHIGILAPEKDGGQNKSHIDKFSKCMREARDTYGFSPVIIQQLNRNLSDVSRQKMGDLSPQLNDFADSSTTQQDADVIIAMFDPYRHKIEKENGYDLKKLKDTEFKTFYRSLHILKNSFGSSNVNFPLAFEPVFGIFKTLPRKDNITEEIYQNVISGNYFLED